MAVALSTTIRNARADAITAQVGTSAFLRMYSGTRPATGGTVTTLLAELVCNVTAFAGAAASAVLTVSAITTESSANASGTATWGRIVKSDGTTFCMDFNIGTTGSDMNLTNNVIVAGQPVAVSAMSFTEANA